MRLTFLFAAATVACCSSGASAQTCYDGQCPAPPELAARMALPECGFAATKRWGSNGFQWCDARNMYPRPYASGDGRYVRPRRNER